MAIDTNEYRVFCRIGIVIVADGSADLDARKSNAAVAIARAFYFIKNEKNHRKALQLIIEVS